jgi:hypothetical protein
VASELSFLRYPEATAAVTGVQLQVSTQVPFPLNKQLSHDALQEPEAMGQSSLAEVSETCKGCGQRGWWWWWWWWWEYDDDAHKMRIENEREKNPQGCRETKILFVLFNVVTTHMHTKVW